MATSGKSTPESPILTAERSTDSTEEDKSESSSLKLAAKEQGNTSITITSDDGDTQQITALSPEETPLSIATGTPPTETKEKLVVLEGKYEVSANSLSNQNECEMDNDGTIISDVISNVSNSENLIDAEQSAVESDKQRSNFESEKDAAVAPVESCGTSDNSRLTIESEEFSESRIHDIISIQNGNNQILERSPGERYLRFSEKLGSGASKDVYRAYDTEEGIEVAWNVVHLAGVPKNERNRIVNEVRLLERLHHQNIISFHGSWINREQQQVNFVTEILSSGTLKSFIDKVQVIRWKIAKRWAVQILKGLEYLHSQDPPVIHRDLKCENIFINGTSGDLRIGDLGLSTVHQNGKALSVLGTPEFMAPDMYEEGSYDEKVDIYAFGMCLLEIFTKEIPYKECNNPAQIYKKVTRGAPPDSLGRLKSTHARKFIELCLGYRNDAGNYIRPSATELLNHPFLVKRAVDDEEVEVDPPLYEQVILETGKSIEKSSTESKGASVGSSKSQGTTPIKEPPTKNRLDLRRNSLDEEESDRFEEMPDSEVNNMKKVKVMMGRGEELKEDEEAANDTSIEAGSISSLQSIQHNDLNGKKLHYLVAAAVIEENEQTNNFQQQQRQQPPYHDDVLKLVITLPVEGQTQNVQFDFHLVEDDPIQVAKEMVAELGIPEDAVLEISETVSGLARVARTKKHQFSAAQSQQNMGAAGHMRNSSQIIGSDFVTNQQTQQVGQSAVAQQQVLQQQQPHADQGLIQPNSQQPVQDYRQPQQQQLQPPHGQNIQQPEQQQNMTHQDQSVALRGQQQLGNTPPLLSQIQQIQPQCANNIQSDNPEFSYAQVLIENNSKFEPSNHQQAQMNGEFRHHGHISSESEQNQPLVPYGRSSSASNSTISIDTRSSISSHPIPSSIPQHILQQQSSQMNNHGSHEIQVEGSGNTYSQQTTSQIQTQTAQYPTNQKMQGQHLQSGINRPGQGYLQSQQQQLSLQQAQNLSQQQQQLAQQQPQQRQSIQQQQQQHLQNMLPQPPLHRQLLQQPTLQQLQQQGQNQQHQDNLQSSAQHQQQASVTQKRSSFLQNQSQLQHHSNPQMSGYQIHSNQSHGPSKAQRIVASSDTINLSMQENISQSRSIDFVPHSQQSQNSRLINQEGSVSSTAEHSREDSQNSESMGALEGLSIDDTGNDEQSDEICTAELRKLDKDFENNLKRTKKVFVNRMDNLQRTQVQREAQHQKTLEQHQKDRAAFEKRLQQEEIEQNRRIEQMQKEWDRRRDEVRLKEQIN